MVAQLRTMAKFGSLLSGQPGKDGRFASEPELHFGVGSGDFWLNFTNLSNYLVVNVKDLWILVEMNFLEKNLSGWVKFLKFKRGRQNFTTNRKQ